MSPTQKRVEKIAMTVLKEALANKGINLNPKTPKEDIENFAGQLGLTTHEMAETAKEVYTQAYWRVMDYLEKISRQGSSKNSIPPSTAGSIPAPRAKVIVRTFLNRNC